MMIGTVYNVCTPHSDLLGKLDSAEATGDSKSTSEERGGARGGVSEAKTSAGSNDSNAGGGRSESENSLTYTKEQVEVVQRSVCLTTQCILYSTLYNKVLASKAKSSPKFHQTGEKKRRGEGREKVERERGGRRRE